MEAKEYPRFDAKFVREHYQHKQEEYWKREGIKEVVDWVNKHGITHGVVGSKFILSPHTGFNSTGWRAKLKEWHIETG